MAFKDLSSQTDHKTVKPRLQRKEKLLFQHQPQLMPNKQNSNWPEHGTVMTRHTHVAKFPYLINQGKIRILLRHAKGSGGRIKDFAGGTQTLTKLPRDDMELKLSDDCKATFPFLKEQLMSHSIIRGPDWNYSLEVMCEASNYVVGATLSRKIQGKSYVFLYTSEALGQPQRNDDVTEKEMIVFAFVAFRQHLLGSKVTVCTNQAAIKNLSSKKGSNPHLIRWLFLLREFE
ncbi:uncharacterized protein LOC121779041 [Salvia splendens]|uniref:uncharacterized protein LOC121779041 n=1 Tax=Salvia splendens TaxID=180675 RepID=UPI001C26F72C|nr:uncharacterized protein LOC121779041 [Salvia splendens]